MFKKKYGTRRQQAAAAAVARARATILSARRLPSAPPRTGGFFGTRRTGLKEQKVIDSGTQNTNFSAAGAVGLMNGVALGTDYTDRIGRKIVLKSIFMKFTIQPSTTSCPSGDSVRLLVVYDSQTNGAAPAVGDILNSATHIAPMNLNNRDRFKVLFDKHMTTEGNAFTAGAITAGASTPKFTKFYKKLDHEMIFQGTAATVGSIATGAIWLLLINLQGNLTNVYYNCRVRFEDA